MKIRNGFVSNSSSSSFIVSDEHFPTVKDLAFYMIKRKIEDSVEDKWYDESVEYNNKLINRLKNVDDNSPVSFSSCNYDTYIKKVGDCYLVSTCNNTDWDLHEYTTRLTDKAKDAIIELANNSSKKKARQLMDIIDEPYEFYHIDKDYYDLDHEIIGVETYDKCPNADKIEHPYSHIWNTVKHGKICIVCNQVWKRKEKLEIINKSSE